MTFSTAQKDKTMTRLQIALFTIATCAIVIIAALYASLNSGNSTIITLDGKRYVNTAEQGLKEVKSGDYDFTLFGSAIMEYGGWQALTIKTPTAPAITVKTTPVMPASLPHTAVGYGDYTCTLFDNGSSFTVTQTTPCE